MNMFAGWPQMGSLAARVRDTSGQLPPFPKNKRIGSCNLFCDSAQFCYVSVGFSPNIYIYI